MDTFPERAGQIARTAQEIAKLQGASLEATVLGQAAASLVETGYDNWNAGTNLFTLMLEVPVPAYAAIGDQCAELEHSIQQRVSQVVRTHIGNCITDVVISPILARESRPVESAPTTDTPAEEIPSFWQPGFFRLFITHVVANKIEAHQLKKVLVQYQVVAFVAHDDVEPAKEWQAEIDRALRTMDALVAIMSQGFLASRWCDQEVGFAMGRSKLVIPLQSGADPHGFLGKYQALPAAGLEMSTVADKIFRILVKSPSSAQRMADALVDRLASSSTYDGAKRTMELLARAPRLNTSQVARLFQAIDENSQVGNAFGVPDGIRTLVARAGKDAV